MNVSELARTLGLPEDADQRTCLAEIAQRKRAATRREMKPNNAELRVDHTLGFAEEIGPDKFLLEGNEFSGAQLKAVMEARGEAEHAERDLRAEFGLDQFEHGAGVDQAAKKLLAERGIWEPSAAEYLEACLEVGAR